MIDTDKYEGHTPAPWGVDLGEEDGDIINSDSVVYRGQVMDWLIAENIERENLYLIADAPLLLAEVKRLQKLEAAVVGSWMRACDHRGPWHKALRYPCVELGYLTYNAEGRINYELSEEYQNMAKEWVKEHYGDEEE